LMRVKKTRDKKSLVSAPLFIELIFPKIQLPIFPRLEYKKLYQLWSSLYYLSSLVKRQPILVLTYCISEIGILSPSLIELSIFPRLKKGNQSLLDSTSRLSKVCRLTTNPHVPSVLLLSWCSPISITLFTRPE
jgi:hypothetical protein